MVPISIIANGLMVQYALEAAKILAEQDINARVIDIHTIKPIDRILLLRLQKKQDVSLQQKSILLWVGLEAQLLK